MWAMIAKEFRELRRDRRTVAMMIVMPVMLLIVFGYAANFRVSNIPVFAAGPQAAQAAARLPASTFKVTQTDPGAGEAQAEAKLRDGAATIAIVTGGARPLMLIDGSQLFSAQTAEAALARTAPPGGATSAGGGTSAAGEAPQVKILYNPDLNTSWVMVPGIAGMILVFIGTLITSLGVVRERQSGTMEQLAVMPFRAWDVIAGKIAPYLLLASIDLAITIAIGMGVFHVPFTGNAGIFVLGSALFLLVTTGMGVLISTVSQTQGQAIQLAFMTLLPQVLLSGLIFPVDAMAAGVRWISYILPLTYFIEISRGVMLKDAPLSALWQPIGLLAVLAVVVLGLAIVRFRRDLAPSSRASEKTPSPSSGDAEKATA